MECNNCKEGFCSICCQACEGFCQQEEREGCEEICEDKESESNTDHGNRKGC